jgi:hypothetical protein
MTSDPCGLSDFNRIETYGRAELFLMLVGTGVSRSLYELTAHDTQTRALLFDLWVEASLDTLIARGRQAGVSADEQAMTIAFDCACRILDAEAYRRATHFHLHIQPEGEALVPPLT